MTVVEECWSGVLRRLQAEVDVFNRLISHKGEKGQENELAIARVLERLIPRRYGVGSGLLIDSTGQESQQTDIVIFNHAEDPAVLAQTTQVLFPVENVHACIEVKTRVAKSDIVDAGKKHASLEKLQPVGARKIPLSTFLGFTGSVSVHTLVGHIQSLLAENVDHRPDVLCVLELGIFAARRSIVTWPDYPESSGDYIVGLACLHEQKRGIRTPGQFRQPPDGYTDADYHEAGVVYPVVDALDSSWIVEPSRVLLLFCEALVNVLAAREGLPMPAMSSYITSTARELLLLSTQTVAEPELF
jgi:hypothetical protein